MPTAIDVFEKVRGHERSEQFRAAREADLLPYFRRLEGPAGPVVEMEGGVRFFCHGTATRGLKVGSRVSIEAVDQIYYFSMLGLGERARLFWRRGGIRATQRLAAFARSAAKRRARTATERADRDPNGGANGGTTG